MKKTYLILILLCNCLSHLFSSTPTIIELKQEYNSCKQDSCKSTGALRIGTTYLNTNLDSTLHYCSIAQNYNNENLNRGFQINIIKGIAYLRQRKFNEVDSIYELLEPDVDKVKNGLKTAYYGNASNFYYRQKKNDLALEYCLKSLEVLDSTNIERRVAIYGNISNIYARMNDYYKAISILNDLHHFVINQKISEQDKVNFLSRIEYMKVLKYKKVSDWERIRERYKIILEYKTNDTVDRIRYLNGYSSFCMQQNDIQELKKTIKILDGLTPKMRLSNFYIYSDIKVNYLIKIGNLDEAYKKNEEFKDYLLENSFEKDLYLYLNNKAEIYKQQDKLELANDTYFESLENQSLTSYIEDEIHLETLKGYLHTTKSISPNTLLKLRQYTTLKDSLHELAFSNRVAYLNGKFENDKLKNENQVLSLSNEIKENFIQSQKTKFIGLGIGCLSISILSFLLYRMYKKEQKLRKELNKKKNELELKNREMKHRSRGYLNSAINMLSEQRRNSDTSDLENALYKTEQRIRALSSVSAALDNPSQMSQLDILISDIIKDLTYKYDKEIKTTIDIENLNLDNHQIISIALITNELIFNSLKYAFENTEEPKIELSIKSDDKTIQFNYIDNGSGLDGTIKGSGEGRQLIYDFVSQVHGKFEERNTNGYIFNMVFNKIISYA